MLLFEIILIAYFIYTVSYALFFSIGGLFYKRKKLDRNKDELYRFAVLVPGYKEDQVILNSVSNNLRVKYPNSHFDLIVIADSFNPETLEQLKEYPVKVKEVVFEKSTKVKSLKKTVKELPDVYDYIVILDADNEMEEAYLEKVNSYLHEFHSKVLQTQRWPKNNNTKMAVLDGISESINNHIYRQGAYATGFSVSLSGSGMVFERHLFQKLILQMDSIGGFDRELEFKYLDEGVKVEYFKEAIVLDQKTDNHGNFQNQRKRWISSQYVYLFRFLGRGFTALLKGNIVYFHSTVWRNIQLPRLINLGLLTVFTILAVVFKDLIKVPYYYWVALWLSNAISMLISIPRNLYNKDLVLSIFMLPKIFLNMFLMMFKLKGANKKFIHTEHKAI